ncbi:MAG: hypothetical protein WC843_03930 [Candidatus Gracilibacteria bacterium]|jgi:hypothetical protein
MMDKSHYYHGAAVVSLLENENDFSISKKGFLGYVVNDKIFIFLKYTTKARTPWRFTFDQEDIDRCLKMSSEYNDVAVGLICGGDGICGLKWNEVRCLLEDKPGWISAKRKHNESYGVAGSITELEKKVPVGRWSIFISEMIKN